MEESPVYHPAPSTKGSLNNNSIVFRRLLHYGRSDGKGRGSFGFSKISILNLPARLCHSGGFVIWNLQFGA